MSLRLERSFEIPGAATKSDFDTPIGLNEEPGAWRFALTSRRSLVQQQETPNSQPIPEIFGSPTELFPNVIDAFREV